MSTTASLNNCHKYCTVGLPHFLSVSVSLSLSLSLWVSTISSRFSCQINVNCNMWHFKVKSTLQVSYLLYSHACTDFLCIRLRLNWSIHSLGHKLRVADWNGTDRAVLPHHKSKKITDVSYGGLCQMAGRFVVKNTSWLHEKFRLSFRDLSHPCCVVLPVFLSCMDVPETEHHLS